MSRKSNKKLNQILVLVGLTLAAILLICSVSFVTIIHYVDLFPLRYVIAIAFILLFSVIGLFVTQRWRIAGIITKIVSVVMIFVLSVGSVYLVATKGTIIKISSVDTKVDVIALYVMGDSPINNLDQMNNKTCAIAPMYDKEEIEETQKQIAASTKANIKYKEYNSVINIFKDLRDGKIEGMLINSKYAGMYSDLDEFEEFYMFKDELKMVFTRNIETKVQEMQAYESEYDNDRVICIYFTGIDTWGSVNEVGRSDVNILAFINRNTHQVFLLSTPRDYYVPLSISDGVRDKLTHSGTYGINVSVETMEMLYEVDVNYYLKVNFTGFEKIINELGGITVHSDYAFVSENAGGYSYIAGDNVLNGAEALAFARERETLPGGDRERGRNQMRIISAIVSKIQSPVILTNYMKILDAVSDCMITDMPYDEIGDICKEQLSTMAGWRVASYSVDGYGDDSCGTYTTSQALWVMIPYEDTIRQAKEYIRQIYNDEVIEIK